MLVELKKQGGSRCGEVALINPPDASPALPRPTASWWKDSAQDQYMKNDGYAAGTACT